jgi:hypothetical protein
MRAFFLTALILVGSVSSFCQAAAGAGPGLPRDPRAVFEAAAPFYNFGDAALKPWHLKASYQLYDDKGDPSEQGTYEYWWASPEMYRSTWTRQSGTHTDWHLAGGKLASQSTGESLQFFEYRLQEALLSPLPEDRDLDAAHYRLDRENVTLGGVKLPCIMVIALMPQHGMVQQVQLGLFPTYCFDAQLPVLRISYSFGTVTIEFNKIAKVQNKYLAKEIVMVEGKRKILTATVDLVAGLAETDAALTPPPDARASDAKTVPIAGAVAQGFLLKKQTPVYPQDAKDARVSGTVVLRAVIGKEGAIHDLHVVSAPWPSLAASSLWSVSHWQYRPYLLNGDPVEVETTVNVVFSLGN